MASCLGVLGLVGVGLVGVAGFFCGNRLVVGLVGADDDGEALGRDSGVGVALDGGIRAGPSHNSQRQPQEPASGARPNHRDSPRRAWRRGEALPLDYFVQQSQATTPWPHANTLSLRL